MTHTLLLLIMAGICLIAFGHITLFLREKKFSQENQRSVMQTIPFIPKMFKNQHLRKFMFYIFILRCWTPFYAESLSLQYINLGYEKTRMVNLKTMFKPIGLLMSCLTLKYVKKGKLMTNFHRIRLSLAVLFIGDYLIFKYFQLTRNKGMTQFFLIIMNVLSLGGDIEFNFLFSFVNGIVDESLGSTSMTMLMVVWNMAESIPTTLGESSFNILGLELAKYVKFDFIILLFGAINLYVQCKLFPWGLEFDETDSDAYV